MARNLLVKQLERCQLKVVATGDGLEAIQGCHLHNVMIRMDTDKAYSLGITGTWLLCTGAIRPSSVIRPDFYFSKTYAWRYRHACMRWG